jgi:hypothetical protein
MERPQIRIVNQRDKKLKMKMSEANGIAEYNAVCEDV